jgi:cytosine/adenosine deaminase-related metal-dependent hydrolase
MTGPPVRNGWVECHRGRIVATGRGPAARSTGSLAEDELDLGSAALLPALVNAHTHLELSVLRGRVPPSSSLPEWVRTLLRVRQETTAADPSAIARAAGEAITEARRAGTGVLGDVANTPITLPLLSAAGVSARVFFELLGFNAPDPPGLVRAARTTIEAVQAATQRSDRVSVALAPHAPYSVSPGLFQAIRADLDAHPHDASSVHLGESPEEVEFIRAGTGPWRALLDELGAWNAGWRPTGTSPVQYLDSMGFLGSRVAVIHGVQFTSADLEILRRRETAVITCPRSNEHVGVGLPPIAAFYAAGLRLAVGTDSLASVADLNLFSELAVMRRAAPAVSARRLLESATAVGAAVLGFAGEHGTLDPGTRADLIAVAVPDEIDDARDVEEYLLTGIRPEQVSPVDIVSERPVGTAHT